MALDEPFRRSRARRYSPAIATGVDSLTENCIGRDAEREAVRRFLEETEVGAGISVCAIRGLGGIGKTTLAYAIASDLSRRGDGAAVLLDCAALPRQADVATVLRALDTDVDASRSLREAAIELDRITALIAAADPPEDAQADDAAAWSDTRRLGLELMGFFSSAAFESVTFGQAGAGSSGATVASAQALASARSALVRVVTALVGQERLTPQEARIALDPETYAVDALAAYFSNLDSEGRLVMVIDKAENLSDRLFGLVMLLDAAARLARLKLTLIIAGLLVRLPVPDGSELEVPEFLRVTQVPSMTIDLDPFRPEQVGQLLTMTHERMQGRPPAIPPPTWLSQAIATISDGLPLWASFIAEALLVHQAEPWVDGDVSLLRSLREGVDFPRAAAQVFREVTLDSSASAFPLLIALAIAPEGVPTNVVCEAAGVPAGAVGELAARHSFMCGERLHDGARAVLRQYLIDSSQSSPEIVSVASALQHWLQAHAPADSVHSSNRDWAQFVPDTVELAFWSDPTEGLKALVNYLVAALPTGPDWTRTLVERTSWFLQNQPVPDPYRKLVGACVRALYPIILADILTRGVDERYDFAVRRAIVDALHARPEFASSTGRYLDTLAQRLAQTDVVLDDDARVGLDSGRIAWLIQNGFETDAYALAADITKRLGSVQQGAPVRRYLGGALLALISQYVQSASSNTTQDEDYRLLAIDNLVEMSVLVDPASAIRGIRGITFSLGTSPTVSGALAQLYSERHTVLDPGALWEHLGFAALEQGSFEMANTVFQEALARYPDWIVGARGRGLALLGLGKVEEAAEFLLSSVRRVVGFTELTPARRKERERLIEAGLIALVASAQQKELAALKTLDGLEMSDYSAMLMELFLGNANSALIMTEHFVASSKDPRWQAPEIAIALARSGRYEEARDTVRIWATVYKPAYLVLIDELLLKAAAREGWFGSIALPELLERSGATQ